MRRVTPRRTGTSLILAGLSALVLASVILGKFADGQPMQLYEKRIISGQIEDVWRIATDVDRWPEWDPHEEAGEIHGPFAADTHAYSKPRGGPGAHWVLTEVTENQSWSLINAMRIGTLEVANRYTTLSDGQVLCEKTMNVSGWVLRALFKIHFETATRKDMQSTWIALEKRVAQQEDTSIQDVSSAPPS